MREQGTACTAGQACAACGMWHGAGASIHASHVARPMPRQATATRGDAMHGHCMPPHAPRRSLAPPASASPPCWTAAPAARRGQPAGTAGGAPRASRTCHQPHARMHVRMLPCAWNASAPAWLPDAARPDACQHACSHLNLPCSCAVLLRLWPCMHARTHAGALWFILMLCCRPGHASMRQMHACALACALACAARTCR